MAVRGKTEFGTGNTVKPTLLAFVRLAPIPVLISALLIPVFLMRNVTPAPGSPLILAVLNTVFLLVPSCIVAYLVARVARQRAVIHLAYLGAGVLIYGLASTVAGWLAGSRGADMAIQVHDTGILIASALHLTGALLVYRGSRFQDSRKSGMGGVFRLYSGALLLLGLFAALAMLEIIPPFFVPGEGGTLIRQIILTLGISLLAISAALLVGVHFQSRSMFLYWYALGILLIVLGLIAVMFATQIGDLAAWVGRGAQYVGSIYLVVACVSALGQVRMGSGSGAANLAPLFPHSAVNYRMLVEAAGEPIVGLDRKGRILLWNTAAEKMFGFSAGEACGMTLADILGSDVDIDLSGMSTGPRTGISSDYVPVRHVEGEVRRRDGTNMIIEMSIPHAGIVRGVKVVTMRDVTELRRMETAVRYHGGLIETIGDAIVATDAAWVIRSWNTGAESIYGWRADEVLGRYAGDFMITESLEDMSIAEARDLFIRTGYWKGEAVQKRKDGTWINVLVSSSAIRDADGKIAGAVSIHQDITQLKQARAAIEQSEKRVQLLIESSIIGITVVDLKGSVLQANRAFLSMLGYGVEDILSGRLNWINMTPGDYAGMDARAIEGLLEDGHCAPYEKEYIARDGRRVPVLTGARLWDTTPDNAVWVCFAVDITERKQAENELRLLNQTLEARVLGRTQELTKANEDLAREVDQRRQAEGELRALSRRLVDAQENERRSIARELHDEIGQNVSLLRLLLDRATRMPEPGMQAILEEAKLIMADLTSRVRSMALDLRPSMLDDLGLLPALVWLCERYTVQASLHINFKHTGLQDRSFDSDLSITAFRIIQEALTNAVRHAGVDKVDLVVWADDRALLVKVEDKGAGFDIEAVNRGISTGLSAMRERASLVGGECRVVSVPGAGTTVFAELPLVSVPGLQLEVSRDYP